MPTRHTITAADDVFMGDAFFAGYSPDGRRGVQMSHILVKDYGAPIAADANYLITAATSTELPNNATITYTPATNGTSPLDDATRAAVSTIVVNGANVPVFVIPTPTALVLAVTHGSSIVAMTALVSGYDEYFQPMSELFTITATGTSKSAAGLKAFRYVSSIAFTSAGNATTNTANLGTSDVFGLPIRCAKKGNFIVYVDGNIDAATKVVADATTATTSTGDVRGTWDPASAADGTKQYVVWMVVADHSTKEAAFGVTQA